MTRTSTMHAAETLAILRWQNCDRALWGRPGEAARDAAREAEENGGLDAVESGIYEGTYWNAWRKLGVEAIAASPYRVTIYPEHEVATTSESHCAIATGYVVRGPEGRTVLTGTVVLGMCLGCVATVVIHDWHRETGWRTEEPFVADLCVGGKPEEVARLAVASRVLWLIARDAALAEHEANSERGATAQGE